jgi:hypothetical protein
VVGESKLDLKTRNRQSAKASRERKKAHLDRLLKQVDDLTSHNLELADVCEELVKDNAGLKAELEKLGCKFDQHGKAILPEGHSLSAIGNYLPSPVSLPALLHECLHECSKIARRSCCQAVLLAMSLRQTSSPRFPRPQDLLSFGETRGIQD